MHDLECDVCMILGDIDDILLISSSIKHLRLICTCQISVFVAPACCHSCGYPNRDNFTKEAVVRSWTDRMLCEATPEQH